MSPRLRHRSPRETTHSPLSQGDLGLWLPRAHHTKHCFFDLFSCNESARRLYYISLNRGWETIYLQRDPTVVSITATLQLGVGDHAHCASLLNRCSESGFTHVSRSPTTWLQRIISRISTSSRRTAKLRPRNRRCFRPHFDKLEDRQLLALVINPTFDASITTDPNAATIEKTINTAIAAFEGCISTPITVNITYQEMSGGLGHNDTNYSTVSYASYRAALASHATVPPMTPRLWRLFQPDHPTP